MKVKDLIAVLNRLDGEKEIGIPGATGETAIWITKGGNGYHINNEDFNVLTDTKAKEIVENNNLLIGGENMNKEPEKFIYETTFHLEAPVNDLEAAQVYLTEDDMTTYLHDDDRVLGRDKVAKIEWQLLDDTSGKIVVETTEAMTDEELETISRWIRGQNSDGLGEGFEQQDFANYLNEEEYDNEKDNWEYYLDEGYRAYDDLDEEERDDFDIDDYAYQYAQEYCEEPNEFDFYVTASFDWNHNDYQLRQVDNSEEA